MNTEPSPAQIVIETRLGEYSGFLDDAWVKHFLKTHVAPTRLANAAFGLVFQWRGAAYTAGFPGQVISGYTAFADQMTEIVHPRRTVAHLRKVVVDGLRNRRDLALSRRNRASVLAVLYELFGLAGAAAAKVDHGLDVDHVWGQHLTERVFRQILWYQMQITFAAVFNAYDAFLFGLCPPHTSREYRQTSDAMVASFGKEVRDRAWNTEDIERIRLVRNAIAHHCCKQTARLEAHGHSIECVDGWLSIKPCDIRAAIAVLGTAADEVATIAASSLGAP